MFVLDSTSVFVLIGLTILRLGVPISGIWLLNTMLKHALPSQA